MLVVDLVEHRVYDDRGAARTLRSRRATYSQARRRGSPLAAVRRSIAIPDAASLTRLRSADSATPAKTSRWSSSQWQLEGKDAIWSMGDDTPLAFLARAPRPIYAYFRQRFAQVTNPAIDPLREACRRLAATPDLVPWPHLLDKHATLPGLSLKSPFLSLGQVAALRARASIRIFADLPLRRTALHLRSGRRRLRPLSTAICRTGHRTRAWRSAASILLLLTDRGASRGSVAHPHGDGDQATVHQALVEAGMRTHWPGSSVEAGDCSRHPPRRRSSSVTERAQSARGSRSKLP